MRQNSFHFEINDFLFCNASYIMVSINHISNIANAIALHISQCCNARHLHVNNKFKVYSTSSGNSSGCPESCSSCCCCCCHRGQMASAGIRPGLGRPKRRKLFDARVCGLINNNSMGPACNSFWSWGSALNLPSLLPKRMKLLPALPNRIKLTFFTGERVCLFVLLPSSPSSTIMWVLDGGLLPSRMKFWSKRRRASISRSLVGVPRLEPMMHTKQHRIIQDSTILCAACKERRNNRSFLFDGRG